MYKRLHLYVKTFLRARKMQSYNNLLLGLQKRLIRRDSYLSNVVLYELRDFKILM